VIFIDDRVGSKEIAPYITTEHELTRLESADFAFTGVGSEGIATIGVERKTVSDLLNSMVTGRLVAVQLPKMLSSYTRVYLLIEGFWQAEENTGLLQVLRRGWVDIERGGRRFMAKDLHKFINTLDTLANVSIRSSRGRRDTGTILDALYEWWQKPYEDHVGHLAMKREQDVVLARASVLRRVAAQLPGIGWKRSRDVAESFTSVGNMARATEEEWLAIDGIGKETAKKVVKAISS